MALREEQKFLVPLLKRRTTVRTSAARGVVGELGESLVAVWRTGVGRARAEKVARAVLESSPPARVVVTGFAGGLRPGWACGDVILAVRTTALPADESSETREWELATPIATTLSALEARANVRPGHVLSATGELFTPAAKRAAAERYDADAVEMEAAGVFTVAESLGLPAVSVRAVLDDHEFELPLDFNPILTDDGRPRPFKALVTLGGRPSVWPQIGELRARSGTAGRALRAVLPLVVGALEEEAP